MMTKFTLAVAVFSMLGLTGLAQEQPLVEIFGGYSYSHQQGDANLNGWNGQVAVNLSEDFGLVGDVSHHYMGSEPGVNGIAGLSDVRLLSYTVGPRATNRSFEPVVIFVHALMGQSRLVGHEDLGGGVTARTLLRPFTMNLGGGVDMPITDGIGLRLLQIEYRLLRIDSSSSNGIRVGAGVTFSFR